jgi:S-formylglutathione hydrolase FrmB
MREFGIAASLGMAVAMALGWSVLALAGPPSVQREADAGTLSLVRTAQLSSRLQEITLRTPALASPGIGPLPANLDGTTKVRVLLPDGYDPAGGRRYPVLYLFHGGGGNQAVWTTPADQGDAERLTHGLPLIVVMPEGGLAGGYSDWYNGGRFGPPRWQTYHLDQLIPWVDANFRTIPNRSSRATAGLSMGGGGLRYAALRPDLIGITAAFSGDIDILQPRSDWNGIGAPIAEMIWGDRVTQEIRRRGVNGVDLAKNLANTDIAIYTGDAGAPEGVYILQGSTAVHERLSDLGIAHQFTLQPGKTHSWPTWNEALAGWLPHLMARFASAAGETPTAFSYSSISPSYTLYGWDVRLRRNALEFSALEVASPQRFTLFGSGQAIVTTPPVAPTGVKVRVELQSGEPRRQIRTLMLKTDGEGRITLPVTLGPANPFQQFSPEAKAVATGRSADDTPFPTFDNGSRFYRVDVRLTVD